MRSYEIQWFFFHQLNWEYIMGHRTNMLFCENNSGYGPSYPGLKTDFVYPLFWWRFGKTHNAPVDLGMFYMFSEYKLFVSQKTSFSAIAWGISHKEVGAEMATMPWLPCLGNGNTKKIIPAFCRWMYSFRISWGKTILYIYILYTFF